jgi:hypothetical protein
VDRYSSAPFFRGFRECAGRTPLESRFVTLGAQGPPQKARRGDRRKARSPGDPSAAAETWLLRVGWRKHGLLSLYDRPS